MAQDRTYTKAKEAIKRHIIDNIAEKRGQTFSTQKEQIRLYWATSMNPFVSNYKAFQLTINDGGETSCREVV